MRFDLLIPCLAFASFTLAQTNSPLPPIAPKHPETKTIQGEKLVDDYQWLEDGANPQVKVWVQAENNYSRAYLDGIS